MAVSKVILNGTTLIDVTDDTVAADKVLYGYTATKNDGTEITGSIASKTSADLTVSGGTVTAPAGAYASDASASVASGTITNNTSGGTSSGTINRGSQIKVGAGYYSDDAYYEAQANSGTANITQVGTTSVDGYSNASVTNVTVPKDVGFTVITTADTALDTTSDLDITNNAYRRVDVTNNANGTVLVSNTGYVEARSSLSTPGTILVEASVSSTAPSTKAQYIVSGGAWVPVTPTKTGVYYGQVTVGSGSVTNNTTLPSGKTSSGTINRGSYIKIGSGWHSEEYYQAQANSGTVNISQAGTTSVDGYASASVASGAYSASVSSHSISTTPVVTADVSSSVTNITTTTQPSGTDGTDYWTITPSGSVTTTGVSTAQGTATVGTAGYVTTGSASSSEDTVSITPTVTDGTAQYITKGTVTNNTSGGTSIGTINRGSQIKIGAGYYPTDRYYTAQPNSGTKTITTSYNAGSAQNCDGYQFVTVEGIYVNKPSSGTKSFTVRVPNGSGAINFVFTVDSSGNVTITES